MPPHICRAFCLWMEHSLSCQHINYSTAHCFIHTCTAYCFTGKFGWRYLILNLGNPLLRSGDFQPIVCNRTLLKVWKPVVVKLAVVPQRPSQSQLRDRWWCGSLQNSSVMVYCKEILGDFRLFYAMGWHCLARDFQAVSCHHLLFHVWLELNDYAKPAKFISPFVVLIVILP